MGLLSFLGAIAPALIGGLMGKSEAKQQRRAVIAQNREQRGYQLADDLQDRMWFYEDRNHQEARERAAFQQQEGQLDRQVASRGLDLVKLRDQAEAAGFNPLTMLGHANAYSTERGINMNSGGGAVSFGSGGRGYASPLAPPSMSSAGFITEALERGMDTLFNTPPERDPLADALRHAQQQGEAEEAAQRSRVPRSFGYDLTEVEPFSPAMVSGIPQLSRANAEVATGRPKANPSRQTFINVRLPDGQMGQLDASIARRLDIQQYDTVSAGDWAEIKGEIVGEAEATVQFDDISRTAIRRDGFGRTTANRQKNKPKLAPPRLPSRYDKPRLSPYQDQWF